MNEEEFRRWNEELTAKRDESDRRLEEEKRAKILSVQELTPLPRRKIPLPWEDLASLISRAAGVMGYATPGWILHPESAKHSIAPKELPWLSAPLDYQMVGRLLGVDEAALHSLTLRHFVQKRGSAAETTGSEDGQHLQNTVAFPPPSNPYPLFRSYRKTIQVCPRCLGEDEAYDRLYWRATPLLLCPRHRVFLIQACPACRRPIPAPRPRLSTCPSCGGDYRQEALPVPPEADWLMNTHLVFLTRLGVDASELGASPAADESSFPQNLSPQQYWWIAANFLDLLDNPLYRTRLLPFLLRALPVATLVPGVPQSPYLALHYLLASWPVHWWVFLERIHYAFPRVSGWRDRPDDPFRRWELQLERGDCWRQEIDKERTVALLGAFFGAVEPYLQQHPRSHWGSSGVNVISTELLLARQVRSPSPGDLVEPYAWEDLASVVRRVAHNMRIGDPAWILISEDAPRQKVYSVDLPLLQRPSDYHLLGRQLGLEEEALYRLTLHRFAARLHLPEGEASAGSPSTAPRLHELSLLSDAAIRRYCDVQGYTKVCPACLDEGPGYDRLFWRLRPVILCPTHGRLLIDQCPNCQAPVPGLRPSSTTCPYCQRGDYRRSPQPSVPSTSWLSAGQALLLHELTSERVGHGEGPLPFAGSPVLLIEPWQYFSLWERIGGLGLELSRSVVVQVLRQLATEGGQVNCSSPFIEIEASRTALFHFPLASWPHNLLALLARLAPQPPIRHAMREGIDEHFWQFDRLVQHLWSSLARSASSFELLTHLYETLYAWAALSLH